MSPDTEHALLRIAEALERAHPKPPATPDIHAAHAFVWNAQAHALLPVPHTSAIPLAWLKGIDTARDTLLQNTWQFAAGFPANNALLWGARGMGKSALVKAVHAEMQGALALVEIHREDIFHLPALVQMLRPLPRRFILFCDDLSFDSGDASYKSLKTALDGGIEARAQNVLFYATSNRRHLLPREMMENERATAINPHEAAEEKISLSDRFGLWLGFHACTQEMYLEIIEEYASHLGLPLPQDTLRQQALLWAAERGGRSGRVAWQFMQHALGKAGKPLAIPAPG